MSEQQDAAEQNDANDAYWEGIREGLEEAGHPVDVPFSEEEEG
jgi:hypothetical protein